MSFIVEPKTGQHIPPEVAERQVRQYEELLGLPIERLGDIEERHDESFDDWRDEIFYGEEV